MATAVSEITTACREYGVIDNLSRRSRAYNALYALGETPETVKTLTRAEVEELIQLAHETAMGVTSTERHRTLAKASPALLRYIAIGSLA